MAINFGKDKEVLFASTDLMSFGKAFSRMAAQPLDMYEVWYDLAALEEYALNGATAYVGQKVVYIDDVNGKVYQYSIEYDGSLKEIGSAPIGDDKSIVVNENGQVSLKGIDALVFEEEGKEVKYQPLMTAAGLVWVKPSETTVEGLATLIEELTLRVNALEGKVGAAAEGDTAATGLFAEVANEVARATGAEEALGGRIDGLDERVESVEGIVEVLNGEVSVEGSVKKQISDAIAAENLSQYATVANVESGLALKADITYVDGEIDKIEEAIGNLNHFKAEVVDSIDQVTELGVLYLIKDESVAGVDKYNEYIVVNGVATLIGDTTTDLSNYYKKTEVDTIEAELEGKISAESTARVALTERVAALEGVDNATQAELDEYKEEVSEALDLKADKEDLNNYTTKTYVGEFTNGEDDYKDLTSVVAYINKKAEETLNAALGSEGGESAAEVLLALNNYKAENNAKVAANTTAIENIEGKLEGIDEGAQVNVIESVNAKEGAKLVVTTTEKAVEIDDSAIVGLISTAQAKAEEGVANAATAQSKADSAYEIANNNKSTLETLSRTVSDNKSAQDGIANRVTTLETTSGEHTTKLTNLETSIAKKADQASLDTLSGTVGTNTGEITALKTTVATHTTDIADRYTKSEVDSKIGSLTTRVSTAEGNISSLTTSVNLNAENINTVGGKVTALEGVVGDSGKGLVKDVADLKGQITGLSGAMHFRGISSNDPMNGGPVLNGVENPVFASGDVVIYSGKEYVYDGSEWHLFGDEGSYALRDSVYTKSEVYTKAEVNAFLTWTEME